MPKAPKEKPSIVWVSYKQRVRDDIDTLYKANGGAQFFDDKYIAALTQTIEQLESRELKIIAYQIPITICMILTFISINATIELNVLGVPLKDAPGIRELLVAIQATMSMAIIMLQYGKNLRLTIIEKIVELQNKKEHVSLAKLAKKTTAFDLQVYTGQESNRFIFSTKRTKALTIAVSVLMALWSLSTVFFLWWLNAYFVYLIWQNPSIGVWSYITIIYWAVINAVVVLLYMRLNARLPYVKQT